MPPAKEPTFGRYQIITELGRGAMGIVYKAHDPKINRLVAVKTIELGLRTPVDEHRHWTQFLHEAQAAGSLSHPGIVTIFDVGVDPNSRTPYIVMEYVPGRSLEEMLSDENGSWPVDTALQLAQELAEALDYAHAQGLVHRDLKPSNVLIADNGHPKIADFGIAKLNVADWTQEGRAVGTPAYMSPEQLRGDPVDGRSDLFSLGVILYRLLTGYRPFQGNSPQTISFKVLNRDPVPATAFDADLSPEFDYLVSRAVAKDPAQRYQSGQQMALDIQALRAGFAPRSACNVNSPPLPNRELTSTSPTQNLTGSLKAKPSVVVDAHRSPPVEVTPLKGSVPPGFRKPWQQFCVFIVTVGFLTGCFAVLWRAIPANAMRGVASPSSTLLGRRPGNGLPGAELESTPVAKPVSATQLPQANSTGKNPGNSARAMRVPLKKSAIGEPVVTQSARLRIAVEHHFAAANLSVWIDDKLYTYSLRGATRKRVILFTSVRGYLSDSVHVPAGEHHIRVRALSADNSYDLSENISASFAPLSAKVLTIGFDKDNRNMRLVLE